VSRPKRVLLWVMSLFYVFGGLNLAAAVAFPIASLAGSAYPKDALPWVAPMTAVPLAIGVINLTFSALGKSPSFETRAGRLTIVPVTGVGAQNKMFGGIGLQLAAF